jgi:hypothetical protein
VAFQRFLFGALVTFVLAEADEFAGDDYDDEESEFF